MTTPEPLLDGWKPKLIATDIDGTLLNTADQVIPRLREVITRATEDGAEVALATGRPYRWIGMVLDQLSIRPVCVTSNGAVVYDSDSDKVITAHELFPSTMEEIVATAQEVFGDVGGVAVAAERVGVSAKDNPADVFVVGPDYLHTWADQGYGEASDEEVTAEPAVKLILRNSELTSTQMHQRLAPHIDPSAAHVTYSINEGLLEIAAPGVTKALGIRALASLHNIDQQETVSFGDMPNDIEMLNWTRLGVAMRNAHVSVIEAADMVTASNDHGGVADVLEYWF